MVALALALGGEPAASRECDRGALSHAEARREDGILAVNLHPAPSGLTSLDTLEDPVQRSDEVCTHLDPG